jgi:hypothetical protein
MRFIAQSKGIRYLGMDIAVGEEFDADLEAVGHLIERGRISAVPSRQRPKPPKVTKPIKTEQPPTEAAFSLPAAPEKGDAES